MPLFVSSSGVQIHGGNLYEISRDMNVQSTQPVAPEFGGREGFTIRRVSFSFVWICPDMVEDTRNSGYRTIPNSTTLGHASVYTPNTQNMPPGLEFHQQSSLCQPPTTNCHDLSSRVSDSMRMENSSTKHDPGQSAHASTNLGSETPVLLWDGAGPRTHINGGTFVGGNVNHFQQQGETGQ
jgi:hypothetical protein